MKINQDTLSDLEAQDDLKGRSWEGKKMTEDDCRDLAIRITEELLGVNEEYNFDLQDTIFDEVCNFFGVVPEE